MEEKGLIKKEFEYEVIRLLDIENNPHLIFVCDGDKKKTKIESRKENEHK